MSETQESRLKRMRMRAWRRGTKEMDLVLGPYADTQLALMSEADLLAFDALLAENDQDLMSWMLGQIAPPAAHADLIKVLSSHASTRLRAN